MTTNPSHAAPWTLRQFVADLIPTRRAPRPEPVLTGREATARHLFGESVQWSRLDMLEYDNSPLLRGGWLAVADRRIAAPRLPLPEMLVLRHWGYTPAQWVALPAPVKQNKRDGYYQAKGL